MDAGGIDLPPTRVDQGEVAPCPVRRILHTIASNPRDVLHNSLAAAQDAVDQSGFAHVGPTDHRHDRKGSESRPVPVGTGRPAINQRDVLFGEFEVVQSRPEGGFDQRAGVDVGRDLTEGIWGVRGHTCPSATRT